MVLQKELYNDIPNVTVWRVLWKRLHLKVSRNYLRQDLVCFATLR
jgi:hypothetical protein